MVFYKTIKHISPSLFRLTTWHFSHCEGDIWHKQIITNLNIAWCSYKHVMSEISHKTRGLWCIWRDKQRPLLFIQRPYRRWMNARPLTLTNTLYITARVFNIIMMITKCKKVSRCGHNTNKHQLRYSAFFFFSSMKPNCHGPNDEQARGISLQHERARCVTLTKGRMYLKWTSLLQIQHPRSYYCDVVMRHCASVGDAAPLLRGL